jgi:hypothetical protein
MGVDVGVGGTVGVDVGAGVNVSVGVELGEGRVGILAGVCSALQAETNRQNTERPILMIGLFVLIVCSPV